VEPRVPDPYPWPDDELCVWFGRAAFYAQRFEREFRLFLLAAEAAGRIKIDRKKAATSEDYLFSKTVGLGTFEAILREAAGFADQEFEKRMVATREARNEIAHSILQNYDPKHSTPEQRTVIIDRLKKLLLILIQGFLNMREIRKVAEEHIGLSEEQLTQLLRDLESDEPEKT
jgi:hypothetical protein